MIYASVEDIGEASDFAVMDRQVSVDGMRLLDIGCGAGALTRALAARGAEVVGIEPDPIQAEKNRQAEPVPGVSFVEGGAQRLDIADDSVDGVFFKYSLHHVPAEAMDEALAEAVRVLKDDGFLYVTEPVMVGSYAAMTKPFNDETNVRRLAYEALARGAGPNFKRAHETRYCLWHEYVDFETFVEGRLGQTYNDHQRAQIDTPEVRAMFEAGRNGNCYRFQMHLRVNFYQGVGAPDESVEA
ncbi:MAG: class I SAM-dependent methyltransferase [Alphaproteobacteria bacterium]